MNFTIYTDGGCSGNKRDAGCKGAWAGVILDPGNQGIASFKGFEENTTNNRMELSAVFKGLKYAKEVADNNYGGSKLIDCIIITDSMYVVNNYEDYVDEWKKNGWRKSGGGSVINFDIWKMICSMTPEFKSVKFQWVKGHSTNKFNQQADALVRSLLY